ncbi:hypothetical protein BV22DRAFT_1040681 [Leucogyrophana mollusca]|uniref:Uncharacterized protein n=1 Tax=Leucogyrophana mollusca TaxID=85980 RepID=A0ACB8B1M5_9AGAM|nr:hypothetical protein BV22DRAFT_1040681 [Leucogyrophana mollusca]
MASVTEESPPASQSTENIPEASNSTAKGKAPARTTVLEAQSYHPSAQTVDHSAERNDDPTRGGIAPDPAAQDVQSQLLQKILGTLEESNETLKESNKTLKESTQTLKASTIAQETSTDTRSRFWATYKRQADDYDSEFLEKYKDDMDIVLIFVSTLICMTPVNKFLIFPYGPVSSLLSAPRSSRVCSPVSAPTRRTPPMPCSGN